MITNYLEQQDILAAASVREFGDFEEYSQIVYKDTKVSPYSITPVDHVNSSRQLFDTSFLMSAGIDAEFKLLDTVI